MKYFCLMTIILAMFSFGAMCMDAGVKIKDSNNDRHTQLEEIMLN